MRYNTKKRAKQQRKYSTVRRFFLFHNPSCQAGLSGCTHTATEIHHQKGRIGELLTDVSNFLAICHSCHQIIEHEPILAKEHGHSKSRLT